MYLESLNVLIYSCKNNDLDEHNYVFLMYNILHTKVINMKSFTYVKATTPFGGYLVPPHFVYTTVHIF